MTRSKRALRRNDEHRWQFSIIVACITLAVACTTAAASGKESVEPSNPCDLIRGLDQELTVAQRQAFLGACEAKQPASVVQDLLRRADSQLPWAFPALAELLLGSPRKNVLQTPINELLDGLMQCSKEDQEDVVSPVERWLAEREKRSERLMVSLEDRAFRGFLDSPAGERCAKQTKTEPQRKNLLGADRVFLTIVGYPHEQLSLFVREKVGNLDTAKSEWVRYDVGSVEDASAPVHGRSIRVVTVPRSAATWLVYWRGELPQSKRLIADEDQIVEVSNHPRACFTLDIAPQGQVRAFVDGVPVRLGEPIEALVGTHPVKILSLRSTPPSPLHADVIEVSPSREGSCKVNRFDLAQSDSLGLMPVRLSEQCANWGLSAAQIEQRVASFLDSTKTKFDNVNALTSISQAFQQALAATLHGSGPIGAARGREASENQLGSLAHEFFRHGFGRLLSIDVQCTQQSSRANRAVAITASLVNLRKFSGAPRDPLGGVRIKGVLTHHTVTAIGPEQFHDAIVMPVARALDLSAARTRDRPYLRRYEGVAKVEVEEASVEQPRLQWSADALDEEHAARVCREVEALNSLQVESTGYDLIVRWREGKVLRQTGQTVELGGNGSSPIRGAEMTLEKDAPHLTWVWDERQKTVYGLSCVLPTEPSSWLWAAYAEDLHDIYKRLDVSRPEEHSFRAAYVGLTPSNRYQWLGVTAGYGVTRRSGSSPSSWLDLERPLVYDERGRTSYSVIRRSLLAGISVIGEIEFFRHWRAFGRPSLLANFGFMELGGVPEGLGDFRGTGSDTTFDFDVTSTLQFGVNWHLHPSFAIDLFGHFTVPQTIDATRGVGAQEPGLRDVTYDGNIIFGIGAGFRAMR